MDRNAEVLARIIEEMSQGMDSSQKARQIAEKISRGKATYADALDYARESSRIMTASMKKNLPDVLTDGKLFRAEADQVIRKPMKRSGKNVAETAAEIQQRLNEEAGIGINAIVPDLNEDQITGIITDICNAESYQAGSDRLFTQMENFLEGTVDDCVRENADFQYQAGLDPTIERRTTGKCCSWCSNLAGTYRYADVSDRGNDVFRRHRNCHCIVSYNPGNGAKKRQNVHTKRWTDADRNDRIEMAEAITAEAEHKTPQRRSMEASIREQAGHARNTLSDAIRENARALKEFTPESMYSLLEQSGMKPQPLSKGRLKGIRFQDGGGYKVNFGGDGELQYHPETGSHHDGAYWKISGGKEGITRYDENGNRK